MASIISRLSTCHSTYIFLEAGKVHDTECQVSSGKDTSAHFDSVVLDPAVLTSVLPGLTVNIKTQRSCL